MKTPRWLTAATVRIMQQELIVEHGGATGMRDEGLLDSALARPQQFSAYGPGVDLARLAVAYGYGLARNHPFHDGNKRIALTVIDVFLQLNGQELVATEEETATIIIQLAAGELEETDLTEWIRTNMHRSK